MTNVSGPITLGIIFWVVHEKLNDAGYVSCRAYKFSQEKSSLVAAL